MQSGPPGDDLPRNAEVGKAGLDFGEAGGGEGEHVVAKRGMEMEGLAIMLVPA